MSIQITPTQSPNRHPVAHRPGTCASVFSIFAFYSLPQPHHVTSSHPSPSDNNLPESGREVRKNTGQSKNGRIKSNHQHMNQGSNSPFSPRPKPSRYSLICSTSQLQLYTSSPTHLLIPNSIHSWHSNQTSLTLHLKNIHFSQHFSYPMPLLRTMQLVQLLLHIDTSWHYHHSSIVQHTFQRSPNSIPLVHSEYYIPYTTSIRCHLRPQVLKTTLRLTARHLFSHAIDPHFLTSSTS